MSLLDQLEGTEHRDAYDALPESIKACYDKKSWLWLSDIEKRDLVKNECMPELFEE